jgi:TetR/AcrR family transcriptional repressor of uid operon
MAAFPPSPDLADELDRDEADDETTKRVLDAALAEMSEFGIRRTTVDSVAQRAGLARMTVYRRYAGKNVLVQAVVAREMRRFLETLTRSFEGERTVASALERGFAAGLLAWYAHPMGRRVVSTEPEAVLPYLTRDAAPALAVVTAFIRARLDEMTDASTIAPDALAAASEATTRLAQSYALTLPSDAPAEAELRAIARRLILPLVARG